jgi:hypothetical protein
MLTRAEAVILALMALLGGGLFLSGCGGAREAAKREDSKNHLKEIMLATRKVNDVYRKLPPALGLFPANADVFVTPGDGAGKPCSWGTLYYFLLPYVNHEDLYKTAVGKPGADCSIASEVIEAYLGPNDPSLPASHRGADGKALTSFAINYYAFRGASYNMKDPFFQLAQTSQMVLVRSFPDGESTTIGFCERFAVCKDAHAWANDLDEEGTGGSPVMKFGNRMPGEPGNPQLSEAYPEFYPTLAKCNPASPQAFTEGQIQVALIDGSVKTVTSGVSVAAWANALTPDGGEVLDNTW